VIAPGYQDSDAGHWQTLWQAEFGSAATRVRVSSWDHPDRDDWLAGLDEAVTPGAVIVAHSLGCLAALEWLTRHPDLAAGAFLVAVPDPDGPDFPRTITGFARPRQPVATPLLMIGSSDDPYASWDYSAETATLLGAPLVDLGAAGHINTASGRGPWPEGRQLLDRFVARIEAR
jgi:predicted alpha/beta hydrolase family esterase